MLSLASLDLELTPRSGCVPMQGTPFVVRTVCANGVHPQELVSVAASVEKTTRHPIADALLMGAHLYFLTILKSFS